MAKPDAITQAIDNLKLYFDALLPHLFGSAAAFPMYVPLIYYVRFTI